MESYSDNWAAAAARFRWGRKCCCFEAARILDRTNKWQRQDPEPTFLGLRGICRIGRRLNTLRPWNSFLPPSQARDILRWKSTGRLNGWITWLLGRGYDWGTRYPFLLISLALLPKSTSWDWTIERRKATLYFKAFKLIHIFSFVLALSEFEESQCPQKRLKHHPRANLWNDAKEFWIICCYLNSNLGLVAGRLEGLTVVVVRDVGRTSGTLPLTMFVLYSQSSSSSSEPSLQSFTPLHFFSRSMQAP